MALSPSERSLRARIGGYARAAAYDGHEVTKAALRGTYAKDERTVIEAAAARGETLNGPEIARRAKALRRSRMAALSLRAARARNKAMEPAFEVPGSIFTEGADDATQRAS